MKRFISVLIVVIAVMAFVAIPASAASLGISPSHIEIEVPEGGSTSVNFQVHYFSGELRVSLVDIPLEVEPEVFHIVSSPTDIIVTFHDTILGPQEYDGYVRFLGMSGDTVALAVNIGAKVTVLLSANIVEKPTVGGGGGEVTDTEPPRIYNILVSGITEASADIYWTTTEWSTSQVEYWTSPSELTPLDEAYISKHLVHLTDLIPGTTYYYRTMSKDKAGNLAISGECNFTTLGEAPEEEVVPPEEEEVAPPEPEPAPAPAPAPPAPPPPAPPPEVAPPAPPFNWPLVGGIIAAVVVVALVVFFLVRRRAY